MLKLQVITRILLSDKLVQPEFNNYIDTFILIVEIIGKH